MASRLKEGIRELFSSKDDLDYPDQYLNQHRGFQSMDGHNTTLPIVELTVPMCCEKCQEKVKEAVEEVEGVKNVICDQYNQRVTVTGFVDPLKLLRRVKKVKKRSTFFNNATYINATSLPVVSARTSNITGSALPMVRSANGFSETRYTSNPLVRTNSSGFGRFPHEGNMSPMAMAPMIQSGMPLQRALQQQPRSLAGVNNYGRQPSFGRVRRYDNRQENSFVPVDLQRDFYGVRRMPSFKNHRYHDAEYISMGNEYQHSKSESHYVPHHNLRPTLRSQVSFSRLPVNNPYYMKHIESEYD